MVNELDALSRLSRVAEPDEGISAEELGLPARNHAMPLEALRSGCPRAPANVT